MRGVSSGRIVRTNLNGLDIIIEAWKPSPLRHMENITNDRRELA